MTNVECQYMTKAVSSFQIRLLLFLGCTVCCLNHFSNLSKSIYFLLLFRPLEILLPGSNLNFPPQIIGYILGPEKIYIVKSSALVGTKILDFLHPFLVDKNCKNAMMIFQHMEP